MAMGLWVKEAAEPANSCIMNMSNKERKDVVSVVGYHLDLPIDTQRRVCELPFWQR